MKRLQISAVSDVTFGVHRDRSLDGLGHNFLCILGPNESGKSTLAEFLQWSIGGTVGGAATAERFILPDGGREVTGRLHGTLDGDQIEIAAKFRILQKGAPNDLRIGLLGAVNLDALALAGAFGNVSAGDYAQIHRIRGAELVGMGATDGFSDLFTKFAIGSLDASINPRARLAELQSDLRGADQRLRALHRDLKELRSRVSSAAQRPAEVDAIEAEMADVREQLESLSVTQGELLRQRALVDRASSILPARSALTAAAAELAELGPMSEPWREVIRLADAVGAAHTAVEAGRAHVTECEQDLTEARGLLGLAPEALHGAELSIADRAALHDAAKQLRDTEVAADRALSERDELARSIDQLDHDIETMATALGVEPVTGVGLLGRENSLRDLRADAAIWVEAEGGATQAESLAVARRAEFQLLRDNPSNTTVRTARRFSPRVVLLIIGLLVAAAAALITPLAAAPVAVIAILLAVLLPESGGVTTAAVDDALEIARRDTAESTRMAEEARSRADLRGADLHRALAELGAPSVTEFSLIRSHIQQLAELSASVAIRHRDRDRLSESTQSVAELDDRCDAVRDQFHELLASRGVTSVPSLDRFDDWLAQYENAVVQSRRLAEASTRLGKAEADLDELVKPVAQELDALSWPQRLARLTEMSERLVIIESIEKKLYEARLVLDTVGDDESAIEEVLLTHPDEFALRARQEVLTSAIEQIEQDRERRIIEGRDLEVALRELTATEVLAALHEEEESLDEEIIEATRAKSVLQYSVTVLNEVIDRFEVENQAPAVKRTRTMLEQVVPGWGEMILRRGTDGKPVLERRNHAGQVVDARLSDGARSLLYFALRLAFATDDADRSGVALPILCDDPLVHLDDTRRVGAIALLADAAQTHQVVLFTCDTSTSELAQQNGARVITL